MRSLTAPALTLAAGLTTASGTLAVAFFRLDQLEKKIDAQGERLGKKIDAQGESLGKKIDAQGERLGKKIDAQGESLGKKIDAQGKKIEDLASMLTDIRIELARLQGPMYPRFSPPAPDTTSQPRGAGQEPFSSPRTDPDQDPSK